MSDGRVINFGAGPSALPTDVLEEANKGLLNFQGTGIGIAEISHRSKEFTAFLNEAESHIRTLLEVPSTHKILFTQGGGSGQFSAVVLNLLARHRLLHPQLKDEERVMDYVVTGSWSKKAMQEAGRLGGGRVNIAADARRYSNDGKAFNSVPPHDDYAFSADPALIYYCENETVDGVQFSDDLSSPASFPFEKLTQGALLPLVADYSSSFLSRPIPRLADHAVVFAGAQKNLGPAGLTILIVRQDCIVDVDAAAKLGATPVPITLSYKTLADHSSLYNTPSVLPIYIAGLVLRKMSDGGGLQVYAQSNRQKFEKIVAALKNGEEKDVFKAKVKDGSVSWMNIVFDVPGEGRQQKFLDGADKRGMKGLAGHRSVGGVRVSLYNAITQQDTDKLVGYMNEFVADTV
ncbi:phosphoserine aminotransferase [Neolentinus lepideus HHB14362 ss-1]|uniref:phosphoserine transaminase n=1 Tax=Neolentinus lepideus HHB14362 ss-1 TaxID=1314782 RepID=A0A165T7Y9_9AGAM|nr:phosphoserine aminotransferase [Neolentinus lepideus HHB14362 ss-1]